MPAGPPGMIMGPDGNPLKVVPVETTGEEAWAGVAAVDRGDEGTDFGRVALLVGGDLAALLLFAAAGRANHGESGGAEVFTTALPFIAGWLAAAPLLGAYSKEAQKPRAVADAALTAAKCWAVATPVSLVIRGLSKGYVPPTPFIVVSLVATFVLLVGWRSGLAAATKQEAAPSTPAARMAARKDKQGNPFEFIQLLMSLTKRW